jgi:hypothetical protein
MSMSELNPFLSLTPSGLLGLVVVMVMFGWLVPIRIVRGRLADKDAIIADLRQANAVLKKNNDQLLRGNTATVQVLDALPDVVGGETDAEVV